MRVFQTDPQISSERFRLLEASCAFFVEPDALRWLSVFRRSPPLCILPFAQLAVLLRAGKRALGFALGIASLCAVCRAAIIETFPWVLAPWLAWWPQAIACWSTCLPLESPVALLASFPAICSLSLGLSFWGDGSLRRVEGKPLAPHPRPRIR